MLNWAEQFNIFCFLDNCGYDLKPHRFECLLGADAVSFLHADTHSLQHLDERIKEGWWFGHLAYELQHGLFGIETAKPDPVGFPLFYFFRPRIVMSIIGTELRIEGPEAKLVYKQMMEAEPANNLSAGVRLQERLLRSDYMEKVERLKEHMQRGDCYEANLCQEFYATRSHINPQQVFRQLVAHSPTPFAALYRLDDRYLVCASPERFIHKEGSRIIAQPIKGTARRGIDADADERLKEMLRHSTKERAENIMIVDLLRNDLSRVCREGSVNVDELMGVYTFPQVHQLISTISGELADSSFAAIINAVFPMGSMTGAPKQKVLQLIDRYETVARGIFSGSVGYIHPSGDFDFNVVIRSILYNEPAAYISCPVGSGITVYCDAVAEWEECMLKAEAIKKVLAGPALL